MAFNIFTTKRISRFGQYDRIDDLISCNLRGDKCPVFRQIAGNEVVYSVVLTKAGNPLGREDVESHFKRELSRRRQCRSLEKHGDFLRDFRGEPFIPQPLNSCTSSEFSMSSWCFSTFCRN